MQKSAVTARGILHAPIPPVGSMESKKPGRIDRHKSDFDVMEHVIGGFYPPHRGMDEPRGHANDDSPPRRSGGQKPSHPKPKLRHK